MVDLFITRIQRCNIKSMYKIKAKENEFVITYDEYQGGREQIFYGGPIHVHPGMIKIHQSVGWTSVLLLHIFFINDK